MGKSFYPDLTIDDVIIKKGRNRFTSFTLQTIIRKEHDGIWYLHKMCDSWEFGLKCEREKIEAINKFHRDAYLFIIASIGYENIGDKYGVPAFERDVNKESELDRIKKLNYL